MADKTVVLVTGSNGGFGRLTALTLAKRGCAVFAGMRNTTGANRDASAELVAWARREGAALRVLDLDVTDDASVDAAVRVLLDATGNRIDAVVNNAGVNGLGHVESFTTAQVQRMLDVNVLGPQRVNRAVLPAMRARGSGVLVHVSSVFARMTLPCLGVFGASKAALEALAVAYRYELAAIGIDSVIVEPGAFPTDAMRKAMLPDDAARGAGYGASAALPERLGAAISAVLSGPSSPDPQRVADAIAHLIYTPTGSRPVRTVVDPVLGRGPEAINTTCDAIERGAIAALGIGDLIGASATATPPGGLTRVASGG